MSSEIEEILDDVAINFKSFKNFDVIPDYPYEDRTFDQRPSFWSFRKSKVQLEARMEQEWRMLRAHLPNSICVRAYEGRKDFMTVVIIALEDSPYSYGLFFFDIRIPSDYPNQPPKLAHHRDTGLLTMAVDYNLSCTSGLLGSLDDLVNAFEWDPLNSSILSLLGFVQRKILIRGKLFSKNIGEDFMLSNMAMVSLLRRPPIGFKDFVKGHFRNHSHKILIQFKGKGGLRSKKNDNEGLCRLYVELLITFENNGSYCNHLYRLLKDDNSKASQSKSFEKNLLEQFTKKWSIVKHQWF